MNNHDDVRCPLCGADVEAANQLDIEVVKDIVGGQFMREVAHDLTHVVARIRDEERMLAEVEDGHHRSKGPSYRAELGIISRRAIDYYRSFRRYRHDDRLADLLADTEDVLRAHGIDARVEAGLWRSKRPAGRMYSDVFHVLLPLVVASCARMVGRHRQPALSVSLALDHGRAKVIFSLGSEPMKLPDIWDLVRFVASWSEDEVELTCDGDVNVVVLSTPLRPELP